MGNQANNRQKAKELGAPEVEELIAIVPYLARLLTKQQVVQFQTIIDAKFVNPVYIEAYNKAIKDAAIGTGPVIYRDKTKVRRARRALRAAIRVPKNAAFIRVDHTKMLTADALVPRSNNPDEADFLAQLRLTLDTEGIWLQLAQPMTMNGFDPKVWEFWFTLGRGGNRIETEDAIIDRREILGPVMMPGGHNVMDRSYFLSVIVGRVQKKLEHATAQFDRQLESGRSSHQELIRFRKEAAFGVVGVSDLLGGANFPSTQIWDRPFELRMKAMDANLSGDVIKAQVYLLAASSLLEDNAQLLAKHSKNTINGSELAVKFLKVAVAAGAIADGVLTLTGVGAGMRALRTAGGKVLSRNARHEAEERFINEYARRAGVQQGVRYVPQPKGSYGGSGITHKQSSGGIGLGMGNFL